MQPEPRPSQSLLTEFGGGILSRLGWGHGTGLSFNGLLAASHQKQGQVLYRSWKTWKVMEFIISISSEGLGKSWKSKNYAFGK